MHLFEPLTIRELSIPNRIVVSPMSQYISKNGYANDWHFAHLSRFALGGAGLIFIEACAVEERGRRTHGDLGLWEDGQIKELQRLTSFVKQQGATTGIQLAHAGRKASERRPWHGETPVNDEDQKIRGEAPWQSVAPSDLPYAEDWHIPQQLTLSDIGQLKNNFKSAAARSRQVSTSSKFMPPMAFYYISFIHPSPINETINMAVLLMPVSASVSKLLRK
jgi:2,4-dienoyl-CoA reductase-like NADH-dependent reductase (Old Yellow Enzyme family)